MSRPTTPEGGGPPLPESSYTKRYTLRSVSCPENVISPSRSAAAPEPTLPPRVVLSARRHSTGFQGQVHTCPTSPRETSESRSTGHATSSPHHARAHPSRRVWPHRSLSSLFSIFFSQTNSSRDQGSNTSGSSSSSSSSCTVKSYRSTSSHSPLYMFKNAMTCCKELPYEHTTLTDEQFKVLVKLTQDQQAMRAPGTWRKVFGRTVYFTLVLCFVYFFLVGKPIWDGSVVWFWRFYHGWLVPHSIWGMIAFIIAGTIRNVLPQIFCTFDRGVPVPVPGCSDPEKQQQPPRDDDASESCIIIPCYKAAETLRRTIPACLAIFKPEQIFIIANGNSPTPLDNTAEVCAEFGVRHYWVPVGSKITAEFVGVAVVAREYKYCMLIDDDVLLPPNLPLPTYHFDDDCGGRSKKNRVACVGYTIKSVGSASSRGTLMQQAQDLEYKVSGLAKVFQAHYGSVVFPHGAIALWRRDVLEKIFHAHPGYHISEDWYLGHTARSAGYRMVMSSQLFVETETPPRLFPPFTFFSRLLKNHRKKNNGGSRGGYGEMSIYKQRFFRWNFFFLFRMWNNFTYIIFSWRLGWREPITKLYVFGECYDSLIRLVAPVVFPVAMAASWRLTLTVSGALLLLNYAIIIFFNIVHLTLLRRRGKKKTTADDERVSWRALLPYIWLKFAMVFVNIASVYWSIYEYAFFFTQQHLMVTENPVAWQVIRESMGGGRGVEEGGSGVVVVEEGIRPVVR